LQTLKLVAFFTEQDIAGLFFREKEKIRSDNWKLRGETLLAISGQKK